MNRGRRVRKQGAPLSAIANGLIDRRLARNLKQEEVAKKLGTTRGTYSTIEAGYCIPSKDLAAKLCAFFECELADLFPDDVVRRIA